jgi:hypothetical protein
VTASSEASSIGVGTDAGRESPSGLFSEIKGELEVVVATGIVTGDVSSLGSSLSAVIDTEIGDTSAEAALVATGSGASRGASGVPVGESRELIALEIIAHQTVAVNAPQLGHVSALSAT